MKDQVKAMSDDNLPFWTSIVVKGWLVRNYINHCNSCSVDSVMWTLYSPMCCSLYHKGWLHLSKYIPRNLKSVHPNEWCSDRKLRAPRVGNEGGKEQAKLTPPWKRRKLHLTFPENFALYACLHFHWTLDYVPHGDNIPKAELAFWTDKHKIPYQDFLSPKRM